jgi:hypothetical protein
MPETEDSRNVAIFSTLILSCIMYGGDYNLLIR